MTREVASSGTGLLPFRTRACVAGVWRLLLYLRLIEPWLKDGIPESGRWEPVEIGTPQGSGISPILANVFLHYAVDLWIHHWRRHHAAGQIIVCRYADDLTMMAGSPAARWSAPLCNGYLPISPSI